MAEPGAVDRGTADVRRTTSPPGLVGRGVAVVACCALPSFLGGAVVDDIREDFAFGDAAVGIVFSAFWATAAAVAVPMARLGTRLGPVRALRTSALVVAAVCVAVATLASGAAGLGLLLLPGGAAIALATPAVNVLIMDRTGSSGRAFAFAVATCSPPLGLLAAGTLVPGLGSWLGWRVLYGVAAILALIAAWSVRQAGARPATASGPAGDRADAPAGPRQATRRTALRPLATMMVGVTAANASLGVMPAFLVSASPSAGVAGDTAAIVLAAGAGTSVVARLLAGRWADRHGRDTLPAVVALMITTVVGFVLMATQSPVPFVAGAFLVVGPGWVWLALFLHAVLSRYADAVGAASGVVQTGFFAGGVVGPTVFGLISASTSYRVGWIVLAAAGAVACVAVLASRPRLPAFPPTGRRGRPHAPRNRPLGTGAK